MLRHRILRSYVLIRFCVAALVAIVIARLQPPGFEDFYKGKTVSLVIGYSVGGGYDAYGRLLARHLGKYIPGQPNVVAQNMTGAGSLKAATYIYSVAPKDGLVIGTFRAASPSRRCSTKPNSTAPDSPGSAASPTRSPSASPATTRR